MDPNLTKFVVGLGNPGRRYVRTRHNVGYMVLQELSWRWKVSAPRNAFDGEFCQVQVGPQRVCMLAPRTFMNLSGQAVQKMVAFYKAPLEDVLVVLDDMALPVGRLRFRRSGSSGGHKGLGDIIARLGSDLVPRLRIGIGQAPAGMEGADYVLTGFAPEELETMQQAIRSAAQAVEDWLARGMTYVMEKYNPKGQEPRETEG